MPSCTTYKALKKLAGIVGRVWDLGFSGALVGVF